MLLNDNNNLIKKVTFFYDSKNTNMAGPPSSQSELSYEHTYLISVHLYDSHDCSNNLTTFFLRMNISVFIISVHSMAAMIVLIILLFFSLNKH